MKTFKGNVASDFKVVLTKDHIADFRLMAAAEDATPFLKMAQEQHPENDDAFVEAILKNGIRGLVQGTLLNLLHQNGFGGSVSPSKITIVGTPPQSEFDAPLPTPRVVEVERKAALRAVGSNPDAQQMHGAGVATQAAAEVNSEPWAYPKSPQNAITEEQL